MEILFQPVSAFTQSIRCEKRWALWVAFTWHQGGLALPMSRLRPRPGHEETANSVTLGRRQSPGEVIETRSDKSNPVHGPHHRLWVLPLSQESTVSTITDNYKDFQGPQAEPGGSPKKTSCRVNCFPLVLPLNAILLFLSPYLKVIPSFLCVLMPRSAYLFPVISAERKEAP